MWAKIVFQSKIDRLFHQRDMYIVNEMIKATPLIKWGIHNFVCKVCKVGISNYFSSRYQRYFLEWSKNLKEDLWTVKSSKILIGIREGRRMINYKGHCSPSIIYNVIRRRQIFLLRSSICYLCEFYSTKTKNRHWDNMAQVVRGW